MRPHTTYVEQCFLLLYYTFVENTADRTCILLCDHLNSGIGTGNKYELSSMSMCAESAACWDQLVQMVWIF